MAISRRLILKLGVSYGTGAINFGNDSVAYDRALRALPEDGLFQAFIDALEKMQEKAAEEADLQNASEEAGEATDLSAEEPADKAELVGGGSAVEAGQSAEEPGPGFEELLDEAIVRAKEFQQLCARLALSDLFLQTKALIVAMEQDVLPSAEEISRLRVGYSALIDYLQHC